MFLLISGTRQRSLNVMPRCRALPKTDSPGTSIGCVLENEDAARVFARRDHSSRQADATQTSLCLDSSVLSTGFENTGQTDPPTDGQGLYRDLFPVRHQTQAQLSECSNKPNFKQQLDQFL